MASIKEFYSKWTPPDRNEIWEDEDIRADWLTFQVMRLPLKTDALIDFRDQMWTAWEQGETTAVLIRWFIDSEVGNEPYRDSPPAA